MNTEINEDRFNRVLGLPQVTASGVAIIIGAGIYVLLGPATQEAGPHVWMSFLLSSALCALTAFSYMELSSMFPKAGSEHEFARQAFPRWIAATVGWSMAIALVVASATVALGNVLSHLRLGAHLKAIFRYFYENRCYHIARLTELIIFYKHPIYRYV